MTRSIYTDACDFMRIAAERPETAKEPLSRSEASLLRVAIAKVINMPDEELAERLAAAFHQEAK